MFQKETSPDDKIAYRVIKRHFVVPLQQNIEGKTRNISLTEKNKKKLSPLKKPIITQEVSLKPPSDTPLTSIRTKSPISKEKAKKLLMLANLINNLN